MLKYVQHGAREGVLPDGTRYVSEKDLARAPRAEGVGSARTSLYGMGLMVDRKYGTPVVHHGGSMVGYKSDMMWLPEHGVGAVVLTNSDPGGAILRGTFRRKLLEVLFDGKPEADDDLAAAAKA